MFQSAIHPKFDLPDTFAHYPANTFPMVHPVHWLTSHFAVGGWSPLQRLSGMLTAHMTNIAPRNGFSWHPHRGLEIYTWVLEGVLTHEDTTGGKGDIEAGELQRMFSGAYIEHQELNHQDVPARVIQIWYVADPAHMAVDPHYQQVSRRELPKIEQHGATTYTLIGDESPMRQHMQGRLKATQIEPGGSALLEAPQEGEDLFLYITDGRGLAVNGHQSELGQYDVLLAAPSVEKVILSAADDQRLDYLSFYLPSFLTN